MEVADQTAILFPILGGAFSVFPCYSIMSAVEFLCMLLIRLRKFLPIPGLLTVFMMKGVGFYEVLFLAFIGMII